jgi:hypothetical protein
VKPYQPAAVPSFDKWDEMYKRAYRATVFRHGDGAATEEEALECAAEFFIATGPEFIRWVQDNYRPGD